MSRIIVWFRNDLRVHDHPALATACQDADQVIPIFILNKDILRGKYAGSNRNRFLLECLEDLKQSLKQKGGELIIREGDAATELQKLAKETDAKAVYYTADFTSYAIKRDKQIKLKLNNDNITFRSFAGRLIVSSLESLHTKTGTPHKVFTPFWKNWQQVVRRELAQTPQKINLPAGLRTGTVPAISALTITADLSPMVLPGGESAARKRLTLFLKNDLSNYKKHNNDMAADGTSRLSSYLHFGCISPLEVESKLEGHDSEGARAWHRQLAWREFYHYIIFINPSNSTLEFQQKYRSLKWGQDKKLLEVWQNGKTGYPAVDAAMRQLRQEGWMHNRARLIVGSFLVKDLWLDWRLGEAHFMRMLIDGDQANNNGNWQWIASVGVDPAPVYRRLYNPASQLKKFDSNGEYARRYLPELQNVPIKYLPEPWTMPEEVQKDSNCIIGKDYPEPIVDHKVARLVALERYGSVY